MDSIKKICNIVEDKTYGDYHRKYYEERKTELNAKRAENIRKMRPKCELENCTEYGRESYKGYCVRCFVHLFPEEKVATCFKTKESSVVQFIKDTYYDKDWIFDKKIAGGCSRFRPDIFLDCLTHSLIIEVDENQHESYEAICENKRLMTLFVDLGERPVVLIRFNPDGYITKDGCKVNSCFVYKNKCGLPSIRNKNQWNNRLNILRNTIDTMINDVPTKEISIHHLFYDEDI